jgi:pimeloyl-ACP methyl ester carboxylesterase
MEHPSTSNPAPLAGGAPSKLTELLATRGAGGLAHPGGTLLAHLLRTARRLESWGAAPELIRAGSCHAAYGTAGFAQALFSLAERDLLREQIGDEAEAIVYAYCASERAGGGHELRDRFNGEYWVPPARLREQLAELTAANELDVIEHARPCAGDLDAIGRLLAGVAPWLSEAACAALASCPQLRGVVEPFVAGGDTEIAYRDLGTSGGPRVCLWHGGAGPELTWARQHALSCELALRIPWRRGCPPSRSATRQDWELDSRDLLRVMPERSHVVAHSYGGVGALLAAALAPERFASLVLIEPPLWWFAPDDPDVTALAALGRAFGQGAPEAREAFLALAGLPSEHPQTRRIERLARGFRDPGEASADFTALRAARVRIAVVSGAHNGAIERLCDRLAEALGAERWVVPGAGHAVPRAAGFNSRLRAFVAACQS